MADWYCDKTNGSDGNAGNAPSVPFENFQAAIDAASGGDTIWVANTSAQTGANHTWNTGYGGGNSTSNPLYIRGDWRGQNDDGTLEIHHPAETYYAGEIDAGGGTSIFSNTSRPTDVIFYKIKMHNTSGYVIDPAARWHFIGCEIADGNQILGLVNAPSGAHQWVMGNWFHGGNGDGIRTAATCKCFLNYVESCGGDGIRTANTGVYWGNLIRDCDDHGIEVIGTNGQIAIAGNTIIGKNNASQKPIHDGSGGPDVILMNNIFDNWAVGADVADWIVGYNNRFNTPADVGTPQLDLGGNLNIDPQYVDAANENYAVQASALLNAAFPTAYLGTGAP